MTQLSGPDNQKVHYPLPLNYIDTSDPLKLDRATMKHLIKKMSMSINGSEFKNLTN